MATPSDKSKALLLVLGKGKPSSPAAGASDAPMEGDDYTTDLETALGDLAASLGCSVKDAGRGVEALRTIHDLCDRASGEGE